MFWQLFWMIGMENELNQEEKCENEITDFDEQEEEIVEIIFSKDFLNLLP